MKSNNQFKFNCEITCYMFKCFLQSHARYKKVSAIARVCVFLCMLESCINVLSIKLGIILSSLINVVMTYSYVMSFIIVDQYLIKSHVINHVAIVVVSKLFNAPFVCGFLNQQITSTYLRETDLNQSTVLVNTDWFVLEFYEF